ncbi:MAG: ECF transporter S component [Clostridiales Family XIII bacterium]|nr:ECF transporter S component [Clostridiales Family XIII bacterium]
MPTKDKKRVRILHLLHMGMMVLVLLVLALCQVFHINRAALLSSVVLLASFVPFLLLFERRGRRLSAIMPIITLSAVAIAGRIVFVPLSNIQPVSALVILAGNFFGREAGYFTGLFSALVSNMFLGQGLWTPWQMFVWSTMGYFSGVLAEHGVFSREDGKERVFRVCLYGTIASALYGIVMDSWFVVGFLQGASSSAIIAAYAAGVVLNVGHMVSTVLFLALSCGTLGPKFRRIKRKYDLV